MWTHNSSCSSASDFKQIEGKFDCQESLNSRLNLGVPYRHGSGERRERGQSSVSRFVASLWSQTGHWTANSQREAACATWMRMWWKWPPTVESAIVCFSKTAHWQEKCWKGDNSCISMRGNQEKHMASLPRVLHLPPLSILPKPRTCS